MHRVDPQTKDRKWPKPCGYFDVVYGTSTGGLLAIMLGRLALDIGTCIERYIRLSRRIFPKKSSGWLNTTVEWVAAYQGKEWFDSAECNWLLSHDTSRVWAADQSSSNLWIRGIPGCGKSILDVGPRGKFAVILVWEQAPGESNWAFILGLPPEREMGDTRPPVPPDVLQIPTVLKLGKGRGCEKPISLMNATSASGFSLNEAERNGDRALAGRRALTAAQNKSLLRGGLEGMKFPMMMWLGYMMGL